MSLRKLPEIRADVGALAGHGVQFDVRSDAMQRWQPEVRAAADGEASISMYDPIGEGWDGSGVTAKRIGAALRSIGAGKDVTVNLNSPGGDFFEGVAIYNLLRQHSGKVTVNVLGLAASAASVIAMAGDDINMGDGSFLMIHNAWTMTAGNRHDLAAAAERLAPFDGAMADLYAARTGMNRVDVAAMMDAETWIGATQAVEDGFASGMLAADTVTQDNTEQGGKKAKALIETAMVKAGYSRTVRREAFAALFDDKPGAVTDAATPSAGDTAAWLHSLNDSLKVTP